MKILVKLSLILTLWLLLTFPAQAQTANYADVYAVRISQLSDRLEVLQKYVDSSDFTNIRTYIHGPLGEVRRDIAYLAQGLAGSAKQSAKVLGKAIAADLVKLDFAAKDFNETATQGAFVQVTQDFARLLELLPQS